MTSPVAGHVKGSTSAGFALTDPHFDEAKNVA